jgi:hypothetical protein
MSIRDEASLSAQERAALAGLEARAAADDPRLAANLKTGLRRSWSLPRWDMGSRLASTLWVGPLLSVAGLAIMVLSLSVSIALGVVGAFVACAGLASLGHAWRPRLAQARRDRADRPAL